MNTKRFAVAAVMLLVAAAVVAGRADSAAPAAKAPAVTWEYAHLFVGEGALDTTYNSPGDGISVSGKKLAEIYPKVGGKGQPKSNADLLNLFGQRGWELTSVSTDEELGTHYWFKRPSR